MRIEPTSPAWKAGVLPLNYARVARSQKKFFVRLAPQRGSAPMALVLRTRCYPESMWEGFPHTPFASSPFRLVCVVRT